MQHVSTFPRTSPDEVVPESAQAVVRFPTREAWAQFLMDHPEHRYGPTGYCRYGCGGAGAFRRDLPVGHPLFGKAITCQCVRDRAMQSEADHIQAFRESLAPIEQGWTLDNWIGTDKQALDVARKATAQGWGVFGFYGSVGVGKSGLLLGIVNAFLDRRVQAVYKVATQMLDELRGSYETETFEQEMNLLRAAKVLAIDEMWRFSGTPWAQEKIFQLLDYRYRYWDRLLTVIATNEKPNRNDALWSRFTDAQRGELVEVRGRDLRPMAG